MSKFPFNLHLNIVSQSFDPETDIVIGPWCFQDTEEASPLWDQMTYINPFTSADEMEIASKQAVVLFESFVPHLAKQFNDIHSTDFSETSWRHILIGWHLLLIQVSYVRFRHIEKFIEQHGQTPMNVVLAPRDIKWDLEISHNLSQLSSRSDFDYWLSSLIIRELAPDNWTLTEDLDFKICLPDASKEHKAKSPTPLSLRHKIRDKALSKIEEGRFCFAYGTTWTSQLFFSYFLEILPTKNKNDREKYKSPIMETLDFSSYFSEDYLNILQFLKNQTVPRCYADVEVFKRNLDVVTKYKYRSGKVRVITPDVFNEVEKLRTVLAHETGEIVVATQHGSWYGTVTCATVTHMAEYMHDAFFSWGWDKHEFNGNYVPLPAPLANKIRQQRKRVMKQRSSPPTSLLLVDNIVNLRSARLSGQPMPADILIRRYENKAFLETLTPNAHRHSIFRPHVHHDAGINNAGFIQTHFQDVGILTENSMDNALFNCKLFVSNHYGTTLHTALAANIPTVCFWDEYPPMNKHASRYFNMLKDQNILFDSAKDAAEHINSVWDNLDDWWLSDSVQNAKKDWCKQYARTNPFWVFPWAKALIKL